MIMDERLKKQLTFPQSNNKNEKHETTLIIVPIPERTRVSLTVQPLRP